MAAGGGCWALWRAENDRLARRLGPRGSRQAFAELLRSIQGLPAALPALPLELAVLGNALPWEMRRRRRPSAWIERALLRVLEACAASEERPEPEQLWPRVLGLDLPPEMRAPLHRLAALQAAAWLAARRLERARGLFRLLAGAQAREPPPLAGDSELLLLLQAWQPCEVGESEPLVVQSVRDLKEVLWTSAAFLQGVQELEADNFHGALTFFQAAASGLCSKRVLAQIFTLMGSCYQKTIFLVSQEWIKECRSLCLLYKHLEIETAKDTIGELLGACDRCLRGSDLPSLLCLSSDLIQEGLFPISSLARWFAA